MNQQHLQEILAGILDDAGSIKQVVDTDTDIEGKSWAVCDLTDGRRVLLAVERLKLDS